MDEIGVEYCRICLLELSKDHWWILKAVLRTESIVQRLYILVEAHELVMTVYKYWCTNILWPPNVNNFTVTFDRYKVGRMQNPLYIYTSYKIYKKVIIFSICVIGTTISVACDVIKSCWNTIWWRPKRPTDCRAPVRYDLCRVWRHKIMFLSWF